VSNLGTIRTKRVRSGGIRFYLDFRTEAGVRVYSDRDSVPFADEQHAQAVLNLIRMKVAEERPLVEVLSEYLPPTAKPNQVQDRLVRWIEWKRHEVEAGDLSPTTLREYERYARQDGHFSFWVGRSVHDVTKAALYDWSMWLADRNLSGKTRKNVMGAFHSFLGHLLDREEIRRIPRFPWPKVPEHSPQILPPDAVDAVLREIPEERRGPFFAMADMGLRPGEVRALDVAHFDFGDGWLTVSKAVKGARLDSPIRETKTGAVRRVPASDRLIRWIGHHVDPRGRLTQTPLFINPATGTRYTHSAFRRTWERACVRAGVPRVSLYEGTKHSFATDAVRRGVPERVVQRMLGHRDVTSTRRYAKLADEALVYALRDRRVPQEGEDLSPACPPGESGDENINENNMLMVEAAGIEPDDGERNPPEDKGSS
jgi:integrase